MNKTLEQDIHALSDDELLEYLQSILELQEQDRKEFALNYYEPANKDIAKLHTMTCGTIGIFGGNGSGKTEHALVEGIIRATGIVPESLKAVYPRHKIRGPINMRVVCESLTTVLEPIILPKLQYFSWSGLLPQGGEQGHWGWIPKHCLINGDWKKSYNTKLRILTVLYRNPGTGVVEGTSKIQFMSYDQDSSDFASGDVHYCLHDEPPSLAIWKENRARVMRGGRGSTILVSMTWPDNPALPVDWIFDEIYDRGMPGKLKDPNTEIINIFSTNNKHLDQDEVAMRAGQMSAVERETRIFGHPVRFSNRVHPDFTDQDRDWCFDCGKITIRGLDERCTNSVTQPDGTKSCCHSLDIEVHNNVQVIPINTKYPCLCLLDPHPRKPHFLTWVQVTPNEDYEVVATAQVEGGAEAVRDTVREVEGRLQHNYVTRLMDPNMGASPSGATRELTWQREFDNVGLRFDLADDSSVGRARLNDFIKPDRSTRWTRLRVDPSCDDLIFQMKRHIWADHKQQEGKDQKQEILRVNDDYPALLKYLLNYMPTSTASAPVVFKRARAESHGYRTEKHGR